MNLQNNERNVLFPTTFPDCLDSLVALRLTPVVGFWMLKAFCFHLFVVSIQVSIILHKRHCSNMLITYATLFNFLSLQMHLCHYYQHPLQNVQNLNFHANPTAFAFLCYGNVIWRPTVSMAAMRLQMNVIKEARSCRINVITKVSFTANTLRSAYQISGCVIKFSIAGW